MENNYFINLYEFYFNYFLSFFCENGILENFFKIIQRSRFKDVIIEIIQSVSMLLSNIEKNTSLSNSQTKIKKKKKGKKCRINKNVIFNLNFWLKIE